MIVRRIGSRRWFHHLPFRRRFRQSGIFASCVPVVAIGFAVGFIGAVMGVGGGFLLVPALIYLMRVPTLVAAATSLLVTVPTGVLATVLHVAGSGSVDFLLSALLTAGGVVGSHLGLRVSRIVRAEQLRLLLGLLIFSIGLRSAFLFVHI